MSDIGVLFDWPSLPANRVNAAKRVAEMCTVHATLMHPPRIEIMPANALPAHEHHPDAPSDEPMHDEPVAPPPPHPVATATTDATGAA